MKRRLRGAAGELWRCRFDGDRNTIVVNSGRRDFVFATRNRALHLRYLVLTVRQKAGAEEFCGSIGGSVARAMIELSLYAEEKLKSG
ncbi:MAG: hypothetical protein M3N50_12540 [Pseudomonadota bacterium]|nr:hypothetical protein [Pseudomonadota bacterium]